MTWPDEDPRELKRRVDAAEARDRSKQQLRALQVVATVAAMVPGGASALLPKRKQFNCPNCGRAKLQRSSTMSYCLRCSYTVKTKT